MRIDKGAGFYARNHQQGKTKTIVVANWQTVSLTRLSETIQRELSKADFQFDVSLNACPLSISHNKNMITITQQDRDPVRFHYLRFHSETRRSIALLIAVRVYEETVKKQIVDQQTINNEALVKLCHE